MRYLIVVFALLYVVHGRNLHESYRDQNEEVDEGNDFIKSIRDRANSQMRHRRKARRSYYDDYNPHYDNMRDYSRHQEDAFGRIEKLLDELSWYLKRPQAPAPAPPQPQIVYVPYPIPYPVPQYIGNSNCNPNLTVRWPQMEDKNQNWGLVPNDIARDIDDGQDGNRPISLDTVDPEEPLPEPPQMEHKISQAGMETTTAAPQPGICQAAILSCCSLQTNFEQQKCFIKYKCPETFKTGVACNKLTVKKVIDAFEKAYT